MADEFDFFIAHAGTDGPAAEELYAHLSLEAHVFLDRRCLLPGDDWDRKLPNAQRSSLITVVLISTHSQQAYYEREEIATAIDMARGDTDRHRVVPVFLDRGSYGREDIPYGLRLKHSLSVEEVGSLGEVARKLLDLLRQLREGKQARTPVPSLSGVKPPEWLRSSTAGFLGQTERGPVTPTLVTSWLDYKGLFGGEVPCLRQLSASAIIQDEKGTNNAPTFAKKAGHSPSWDLQLLRFTPISRHPCSAAVSTSSFTKTVFVYVSLPIRRMKVSARRIFAAHTDLM